jgi:hypothetical protein
MHSLFFCFIPYASKVVYRHGVGRRVLSCVVYRTSKVVSLQSLAKKVCTIALCNFGAWVNQANSSRANYEPCQTTSESDYLQTTERRPIIDALRSKLYAFGDELTMKHFWRDYCDQLRSILFTSHLLTRIIYKALRRAFESNHLLWSPSNRLRSLATLTATSQKMNYWASSKTFTLIKSSLKSHLTTSEERQRKNQTPMKHTVYSLVTPDHLPQLTQINKSQHYFYEAQWSKLKHLTTRQNCYEGAGSLPTLPRIIDRGRNVLR